MHLLRRTLLDSLQQLRAPPLNPEMTAMTFVPQRFCGMRQEASHTWHSCSIACTPVKTVLDVTSMLVTCQPGSWKSTFARAGGSDAMLQTQQQLKETRKA